MANDLTNSQRDRQNILNNRYALEKIEEHLALGGIVYEDTLVFTKQQLAVLFEISESTINGYIAGHIEELKANGYRVLRGQGIKDVLNTSSGVITDYSSKTIELSIFTFQAAINLVMLLRESDRARLFRSRILDILIEVVAERSGGHTKYINQRDNDSPSSGHQEFNYRQVETYTQSVPEPETEFEKFLGETSRSLEEQLADPQILDVFKRLKDR